MSCWKMFLLRPWSMLPCGAIIDAPHLSSERLSVTASEMSRVACRFRLEHESKLAAGGAGSHQHKRRM